MRNDGLQDVRKAWKGTGRIIYGKNKVVAKALGESVETEYKEGLVQMAKVSSNVSRTSESELLILSPAPERPRRTVPDLVGTKRNPRMVLHLLPPGIRTYGRHRSENDHARGRSRFEFRGRALPAFDGTAAEELRVGHEACQGRTNDRGELCGV